jgi:hypothetical protein
MQEFLAWLASWQGIAVEQGSDLHLEFAGFPSGGLGLLVLVGCLLAIAFVAYVYRRDGHNLLPWQRVVLAVLRALAILIAILLLLEPSLVAVKRETRPGHTILLLDVSQSMSHLDAFRREAVQTQAAGWREIGVADPAAVPRIELAKALLRHRDGELVKKLGSRNEVQVFSFAGNIDALPVVAPPPPLGPDGRPLANAPPPANPPQLDLARITADGRFSNPGGALRTALDKSRDAEIAAVVVLTDGRRNVGPQGAEVARLLNQRKIPHTFVLGIGDPSETQTVAVTRFEAPEKVFQKDPFQMKANVAAQGYDAMQVTVRLVRVDDKGGEQTVRTEPVVLGGDKQEVLVEWKDLTSEETGRFTYRVELQPPTGEPPAPERHQKSLPVEVIGERQRVLLLAGGSNHEFQILRNLLIRDKTIDVSCWLQSADPTFPQDGDAEVRIDKLPEERSQLDAYDVAILIDPNPDKLTPSFCQMLARHVTEGGCGLWWICGEKYSLRAMRAAAATKPIADLLPVVPDVEYAETKLYEFGLGHPRAFPYALTPEGEGGVAAKVTRVAEGRDESRLLWARLPGFHVAFPVQRPKPAATVIAEDANAREDLKRGRRAVPVIATHFVGAGRVLFAAMDETYRWRSTYEEAYNRYWVNGIRYLFEGRIHAGNSRLRLLASDEKVELGEAVKLTADAKNEALQPLVAESIEVACEKDGQPLETLKLLPVEEAPGTYELQFRAAQTGSYRIRSLQKEGRVVEAMFQVVPAQIEREGPMDRAELAAIAGAEGGELCDTPSQLLAALDRIPSRSSTDTFRTPHAIWDGFATVAFLVAVLALEWLLRKRFNLL